MLTEVDPHQHPSPGFAYAYSLAFRGFVMNKKADEFVPLNLFVPKRAASKFRAIAKDSKMSLDELFDKMVNSFEYGYFLDKGNPP